MANYSSNPPQFGAPEGEGKRRGMSTAMKIVLGLMGGGFLLALLCCGVGYAFIGNTVTRDPDKVRDTAAKIVVMEIPEFWLPMMSVNVMGVQRMVYYYAETKQGVLALVGFAAQVPDNREAFEKEMLKQIEKNPGLPLEETREVESSKIEIEIRGESIPFELKRTEGVVSGTFYSELSGSFDGNDNIAFIYIKVPEDDFSEDDMRDMLKSIE